MSAPKWLVGYAAGATAALAAMFLMGAAAQEKTAFEEIDVQRINIVEPDGTLRMTLSNRELFPELIFHGVEHKHPGRDTAGILFFNDEGTENGGLTFGGYEDENGVTHTTGHLSFDQYDQDQVFRIFHYQTGERTTAGMEVSDRPMKPTCTMVRERAVCCRRGIRLTGILGNALPRSDSWRASMSSTMTTGRGATTSATPRRPSRTLRGRRQEISCSSATCKASVIAGLIPRCSQGPRSCGHTVVMAPV